MCVENVGDAVEDLAAVFLFADGVRAAGANGVRGAPSAGCIDDCLHKELLDLVVVKYLDGIGQALTACGFHFIDAGTADGCDLAL
jgi:hypothetical protein